MAGITNAQTFQFKDIDLHGTLENWNDTLGIRIANHRYLKRDGGETEWMGADQRRFRFKCVFIDTGDGTSVTDRYQQLEASIYTQPLGLLIHPRLGKIQVACDALQVTENPPQGIDAIEFNISFVENAVDTTLTAPNVGPQVSISDMTNSLSKFSITNLDVVAGGVSIEGTFSVLTLSARFALRDVINSFVSTCNTFLQLASDAASSIYQVPALLSQLNIVITQGNATIAYIQNLGKPDVIMWPLIENVKTVQAEARNTYNSIIASKPTVITFTVPSLMSIQTIATRLYGKDAQSHIQEILSLNNIPNPAAIPIGRVLLISAPTIPQ